MFLILLYLSATIIITYLGMPLYLFLALTFLILFLAKVCIITIGIFACISFILVFPSVRRLLISRYLMKLIKARGMLPQISDTEEIALQAGSSWIEKDLFSGNPDFRKIFQEKYSDLTAEEQAFLDHQVEVVCAMSDDWKIFSERDLPDQVWQYLKQEKFFGMIIPKSEGGLGFSALAHSSIVAKLASRSQVLAITVMVPNSLGPGELILHYGTKEQKEHFLPRLASGLEIPCFGLTEPLAGSDATSIKAEGIVFKDEFGQVKIRLNFRKRYITLGAIATIIGLAFRLKDPENILGKGVDIGITCALIDSKIPGIVVRRHDPLGVPFVNSAIIGENVEIDLSSIIGGKAEAGNGWKMLMECLSVGRGISLPATSAGGAKMIARIVGDYCYIRKQFGLSIGKFEGIAEKTAEIAGFVYMLDAARIFTASAIDNGHKPAVANAIAKYHFTEKFREIVNHGMDILGGGAICRGPRNLLAHAYMGAPIAITVEGANIMTRSLIHFGQGAIRCHPFAYLEMKALIKGDAKSFDLYFFKHLGHLIRNGVRASLMFFTRGAIHLPSENGIVGEYERKLAWVSAKFAFYADVALALYGGNIKRKERINGRFGDVLSSMYLAASVLRRYLSEGKKEEDLIFVKWSLDYLLNMANRSFAEIYKNLAPGFLGKVFRYFFGFFHAVNPIASYPTDKLSSYLAESLMKDDARRDRLTSGSFIPVAENDQLARLEKCFRNCLKGEEIMQKVKEAIKDRKLDKSASDLLDLARRKQIISQDEQEFLEQLELERLDAIEVNSFEMDDYLSHKMNRPLV